MWRRFLATFLTVTVIGIAIGLVLGGITLATEHPKDRWAYAIPLMAIPVFLCAVIGLLSGLARMAWRETSPFRTVTTIVGAGFVGLFFGKLIDPRWKSGTDFICMLLAMIAAAVAIRLLGDRWFTLGQIPPKPTETKEHPTDERSTHPT